MTEARASVCLILATALESFVVNLICDRTINVLVAPVEFVALKGEHLSNITQL